MSSEASTGGDSVKKADVEKQVVDQLTAKVGEQPKSISCPGNLKAKVGTTMLCTLIAADGAKYGLTVDITSIEDNTVNFGIKIGSSPTP